MFRNLSLYAVTVFIWGSTWLGIKFQLGDVDPLVSVIYRFTLASLLLSAWCGLRGLNMRFAMRDHLFISLLYLALFGSVIAFGCYLTLVGKIGADRASYATLLFPIIALMISTLFEGYRWSPPAVAGVAVILAGNALSLAKSTGRPLNGTPHPEPLPKGARGR